MKQRFVLLVFLLVLGVPPAAAHDPHEKSGEPWENPAVTRSVQTDTVALAAALGGMVVFGLAARRRRANRAARAAR